MVFCSGFRSNDRITITRDSYFRWGVFAWQPACRPASLSQFVIISFFFSCSHFLFCLTHCVLFSHCMVAERKSHNKCFPVGCFLLLGCPVQHTGPKICPNSLQAFSTTEIQQLLFRFEWLSLHLPPCTMRMQHWDSKFRIISPSKNSVHWLILDMVDWKSWAIINTVSSSCAPCVFTRMIAAQSFTESNRDNGTTACRLKVTLNVNPCVSQCLPWNRLAALSKVFPASHTVIESTPGPLWPLTP